MEDLNETRGHFPTEALYVYESVKLELNFLHVGDENSIASERQLSNFNLLKGIVKALKEYLFNMCFFTKMKIFNYILVDINFLLL